MARVEADREDLFGEAVALVRRLELVAEGTVVVAGWRTTGWLSLYFGPDPMYQFDEVGRLRRAFVAGLLYRTHGGTLAQLRRERTATETTLARRDLSGPDVEQFRDHACARVRRLRDRILCGRVQVTRCIPPDDPSLLQNLAASLEMILNCPEFLAPAIRRGSP